MCLPDKQEEGQALHSLKGVMMQSVLQGKGQDRIESGREDSGHLRLNQNTRNRHRIQHRIWDERFCVSLPFWQYVSIPSSPARDLAHLYPCTAGGIILHLGCAVTVTLDCDGVWHTGIPR